MEEQPILPKPVSLNNKELLDELIFRCNRSRTRELRELGQIISKPHFTALIKIHDEIGECFNKTEPKTPDFDKILPNYNGIMTGETIRIVGIRKKPGEALGLTVIYLYFLLLLSFFFIQKMFSFHFILFVF